MVRVRLLRAYPRGKRVHPPGSEIEVPEHALSGILEAHPPFGEVVEAAAAGHEDGRVEEDGPG